MGVLIEKPRPIWRLRGVKVDFDLTPQRASKLIPCEESIEEWPEDQLVKWNGGRTGVETIDISILWTQQSFNRAQGRQMLKTAGLDPILPVMLASLGLPENEFQQPRERLYVGLGIQALVVLAENDENLLQLNGDPRAFCLCLPQHYSGFELSPPGDIPFQNVCAPLGLTQVA